MTRVFAVALVLAGCGAVGAPANDGSGNFSVVAGVPPEWVSRVDEGRYLEPADCAVLCPIAFTKRVTSCHLARVGGKATSDTVAVVCNGVSGAMSP